MGGKTNNNKKLFSVTLPQLRQMRLLKLRIEGLEWFPKDAYSSTWETEAGRARDHSRKIWGQPELRETLSETKHQQHSRDWSLWDQGQPDLRVGLALTWVTVVLVHSNRLSYIKLIYYVQNTLINVRLFCLFVCLLSWDQLLHPCLYFRSLGLPACPIIPGIHVHPSYRLTSLQHSETLFTV